MADAGSSKVPGLTARAGSTPALPTTRFLCRGCRGVPPIEYRIDEHHLAVRFGDVQPTLRVLIGGEDITHLVTEVYEGVQRGWAWCFTRGADICEACEMELAQELLWGEVQVLAG